MRLWWTCNRHENTLESTGKIDMFSSVYGRCHLRKQKILEVPKFFHHLKIRPSLVCVGCSSWDFELELCRKGRGKRDPSTKEGEKEGK